MSSNKPLNFAQALRIKPGERKPLENSLQEEVKERYEPANINSHPPPPSDGQSPSVPLPTSGQKPIAPERDFNKRANSLERDALPSGLFPGSSKKLYDALYVRTRGAIKPCRTIRATKKDLADWSGIRNRKTIDSHIRYLSTCQLLKRDWELGNNEGYLFEVRLPEEIPLPPSGGLRDGPPMGTDQKRDTGADQKRDTGGQSQPIDFASTYSETKTVKTNADDDTHTLAEMNRLLLQATRDVMGVDFVESEQERSRWRELGQLLADELKAAAQRTDAISSAPAFLLAHLRRRLAQKTSSAVDIKNTFKVKPNIDQRLRNEEKKALEKAITPEQAIRNKLESKFSLDECRRYAEQLHKTGQGITNPGGYATTIHRTGEADELIEKFLHPPAPSAPLDASQCPDCRGTGWWYPKGPEMGVARCKHERLASNVEGSAN